MKTPTTHLLSIMILPAALLMIQCAPTGGAPPRTVTVVPVSIQHWVKVSSNPPTYYPRGVAADVPTDCHSGEWVHTGDAQDSRFFIPLHGLVGTPRHALVQEALAARSGKKLLQIAAEDRDIRDNVLTASLVAAGAMLSCGQVPNCLVDTEWEKEWYSSKQPHP